MTDLKEFVIQQLSRGQFATTPEGRAEPFTKFLDPSAVGKGGPEVFHNIFIQEVVHDLRSVALAKDIVTTSNGRSVLHGLQESVYRMESLPVECFVMFREQTGAQLLQRAKEVLGADDARKRSAQAHNQAVSLLQTLDGYVDPSSELCLSISA